MAERERTKRMKQDHMIDVGGIRLHFNVWPGSGSTVLLECGGGDDLTGWGDLPDTLADKASASIVAYDRAGFGLSDLPATPYDLDEESRWLIEGLRQLELDHDLILVGHSYGGWLIRLHAHFLGEQVKGLILVDAFSHEFVELLGVDYLDRHPMCGADALRSDTPIEELPREQAALVRMVSTGLGPKVARMAQTSIPRNLPVRVISSGNDAWWPETHEAEAWKRSHKAIAATSANAQLIIAEGAGHMIPQEKPEAVVDAVLEVLRDAD